MSDGGRIDPIRPLARDVVSYLACGDKFRSPTAIRPGTPVTCSLHGGTLRSTTVIPAAQWLAEHPAAVSDVGALSPEEAATVEVARAASVTACVDLSPPLARRLVAIIDRLTGTTEGEL